MAVRLPTRVYRTWIIDSRRWEHYRPRAGDVVIATYPKCGTTWMQRIVSLLIFRDPAPLPVMDIAPWIDRRVPEPLGAVLARIEAQTHRRFLKAHLPADGLPLHDAVRYIHVARDGRDACLSYHNHLTHLAPATLAELDAAGLADPTIGRPLPRVPADPADYFHLWLTKGVVPGARDGMPTISYFDLERSWWAERTRPNVLVVRFADLLADLEEEMRRVADFLGIAVGSALWPRLVAAARFDAMRADGDALMGRVGAGFVGGGASFFHRGVNGRWRAVFRDEDVARYVAKAAALPDGCAAWLASEAPAAAPR